eukprot:9992115-Heterocapsa_arctica.AAC.1
MDRGGAEREGPRSLFGQLPMTPPRNVADPEFESGRSCAGGSVCKPSSPTSASPPSENPHGDLLPLP